MGLFSKHKAKGVALHFYVHVHSLGPFPTVGPLAVEWQRGSRRGATRPAQPTRQPGKVWANYDFEESQHIPCTLYEVRAGAGLLYFMLQRLHELNSNGARAAAALHQTRWPSCRRPAGPGSQGAARRV